MKKYADYLSEREGLLLKESEHGFATYSYPDSATCYIKDIFVDPDYRMKGEAVELADLITAEAKANGCTTLLGSVSLDAKTATDNMRGLLHYKMTYSHAIAPNLLIFKKEIR